MPKVPALIDLLEILFSPVIQRGRLDRAKRALHSFGMLEKYREVSLMELSWLIVTAMLFKGSTWEDAAEWVKVNAKKYREILEGKGRNPVNELCHCLSSEQNVKFIRQIMFDQVSELVIFEKSAGGFFVCPMNFRTQVLPAVDLDKYHCRQIVSIDQHVLMQLHEAMHPAEVTEKTKQDA